MGPEMQFPTPPGRSPVRAPAGGPGRGQRQRWEEGAAQRAQRAPRPAASPPLTLGLRLHPSPSTATEGGWPRARGELAGRLRRWGLPGDWEAGWGGSRKERLRGSQVLPRNLHSNSALFLRAPGPGGSRIHCTPPPPGKSGLEERRKPPSPRPPRGVGRPPPPSLLGPRAPRGEGSCHGRRKERAFPVRPDVGRVSCASSARPSPPGSGSWSIKPPNYAWA